MDQQTHQGTPARDLPGSSPANGTTAKPGKPKKRHWGRRILIGAAALVVLVVAAVALIIKLQPTQPPLALPATAASTPAGPLSGTWQAGPGSVAGFRVAESALGFSNDVVGRTSSVSGALTISGDQVTHAVFRVGLTAIKVSGKTQAQLANSLGTQADPTATIALSGPVTAGSAFASGATITRTAVGQLTMHGVTRPATVTITARRDGTVVQVAGSIPVTFSTWGIRPPGGFGFFGSLADQGIAEFYLVLHRE
jgi:polyisoprenoid-binding protein YceI